ncbi:MAG: DUF4833 domain-containing protein [Labilithrix sp.]|nr:DUF4833 domain-containing protein [Labilithrix sp.]MBX3220578.1 DUF4833 domain-containing protein [Labilithrix sp.]
MASHRLSRRSALGGAAVALVSGSAVAGAIYQPLFRIERSKNANVVQYDAVLESLDKLVPSGPVAVYWILLAEDGRREGLSALDRRAYGFKVAAEPGGSWLVYLNAAKDRSIRVLRWQGRWAAQIVIGGKSAVLTRMFVASDESAFIPRVKWVDLFGVDMVTGQPVTERLKA